MKSNIPAYTFILGIISFVVLLCVYIPAYTQNNIPLPAKINQSAQDLFGTQKCFIENIGQYESVIPEAGDLGKIKYGFHGFDMPVLFTERGMIYLLRKEDVLLEKEKGKFEKDENKNEEDEFVINR